MGQFRWAARACRTSTVDAQAWNRERHRPRRLCASARAVSTTTTAQTQPGNLGVVGSPSYRPTRHRPVAAIAPSARHFHRPFIGATRAGAPVRARQRVGLRTGWRRHVRWRTDSIDGPRACSRQEYLPGELVALGVVFGFEWQQAFWVPMFQFEPRDLSVKRGPRQVLAALGSGFDGWKLATWFVRPCPTLNACPPIERLDADVPGVLSAIRADGSIAGRRVVA